jgi:hypothetical protein
MEIGPERSACGKKFYVVNAVGQAALNSLGGVKATADLGKLSQCGVVRLPTDGR